MWGFVLLQLARSQDIVDKYVNKKLEHDKETNIKVAALLNSKKQKLRELKGQLDAAQVCRHGGRWLRLRAPAACCCRCWQALAPVAWPSSCCCSSQQAVLQRCGSLKLATSTWLTCKDDNDFPGCAGGDQAPEGAGSSRADG